MEFPWTEEEFNSKLQESVRFYWTTRREQAERQASLGRLDAGHRNEVTGGKHLDALGLLLISAIREVGFTHQEIWFNKALPVPGYYRAQKKWDICVIRNGILLAAIELKSQSGSFGNNFNNRSEEVIGSARDFWLAYREQAFHSIVQPWLGYCFLLEDSDKSSEIVKLTKSPLPAMPVFKNTSYKDRYKILCERLVLERDYNAAALIISKKDASFYEPSKELGLFHFACALYKHLKVNQ